MSKINTPSMQTVITIVVIIQNFKHILSAPVSMLPFIRFVEQSELLKLRAKRFWNFQTEHTFILASV
jgi:hypothetical protein